MSKSTPEFKIWFSRCCYAQLDVTGKPGAEDFLCQLCGHRAEKVKLTRDERRAAMFRQSQNHIAYALYVLDRALDHYREHDRAKGRKLAALVDQLSPFTSEKYAQKLVPISAPQPEAAA